MYVANAHPYTHHKSNEEFSFPEEYRHYSHEAVDVIRLCCHAAVLWQCHMNFCTPIPWLVFKLAHGPCPFLWAHTFLGNTSISCGCDAVCLPPWCQMTPLPFFLCPAGCSCLVPEPPMPWLLKSTGRYQTLPFSLALSLSPPAVSHFFQSPPPSVLFFSVWSPRIALEIAVVLLLYHHHYLYHVAQNPNIHSFI